jgi:hypothetical protein
VGPSLPKIIVKITQPHPSTLCGHCQRNKTKIAKIVEKRYKNMKIRVFLLGYL